MKTEKLGNAIFAGLLACALAPMAVSQTPAAGSVSPVAGDWKALVNRSGNPIHVILHIAADKTGALTATIDATEMQAYGVVVSNVVLKDTKLTFDVDQAPGSYAGTLNKDATEIDGTWTPENGDATAMNFTRDTSAPAASAPADGAPAAPAQPGDSAPAAPAQPAAPPQP